MAAAATVIDVETDLETQRERLLVKLAAQRDHISTLWAWYTGQQDLPTVTAKYAAGYRLLLAEAVTPWARLVVDAIAERLRVQGVGSTVVPERAREAWQAFKRFRLNADQRLIYSEALIGGTGYVSVAEQPDGANAVITPESAFEVTHENYPGNRRVLAAAVKVYPLDWTRTLWVCELYRPEATYRWTSETSSPPRTVGEFPIDNPGRRKARSDLDWQPLDIQENSTGVVPMVPFENRVGVLTGGASEIEDCIPILQRIDRLTLAKMMASEFASFRQKWATGLEVPIDPDTGQRVEPFHAAVDRLWISESPDSRFGTFDASDVSQYLSAVDSEIAALAAISRVPAHYLLQRNLANPPSAESLIAGETGLVAKVEDRQAQYGESWERVLWLHAAMSGQPVEIEQLEVQWMDAEKRNPAQVADAAVKLQTVGWPDRAVWRYTGATPEEVDQWTLEQAASQLLTAAVAPPTTTVVPPTAEVPEGGQGGP